MATGGPLDGLLVLDLTRVLAGPFCTLILADLGARVIKVEMPGRGDDTRQFGPFVNGESVYFASLNRGKESIALDLDAAPDRVVFETLLARADVLVENFRPGTLDRKGYGWEKLSERFPRLIYGEISGFGRTGPYRERPAYDIIVQAMGGLMSLTGEPGSPPHRTGTSIADISAGMFATIGICAALQQRARTGRGVLIDVAMLDCQVAILENAIARYTATGEVPGPTGGHHALIAPFGPFATADGRIVLAAGNNTLFRGLCAALGRPEMADDPRFRENEERAKNRQDLAREIESVLRGAPGSTWLPLLEAAGIPVAAVNTIDRVVADPQVRARNMLVRTVGGALGELVTAGNPIKVSGVPDPAERPAAPALDRDRVRIIAEFGGG
ncbi:MAG: CoA transferase [Alphaproteobacteria bacterium]|nr:CoA transferase [Alphaproteobacteria bacterium]